MSALTEELAVNLVASQTIEVSSHALCISSPLAIAFMHKLDPESLGVAAQTLEWKQAQDLFLQQLNPLQHTLWLK